MENREHEMKALAGKPSRLLTPPAEAVPKDGLVARLATEDEKGGWSYQGAPGQTAAEALGTLAMHPAMTAATTVQTFGGIGGTVELHGLVNELQAQVAAVNAGDMSRPEAMLVSQAHTLDGIFNTLATRAKANMGGEGDYLSTAELYLRLALRAQNQCRATLETLGQLKNPSQVSFVKQANIANGPQQVNNGTPSARTGETVNAPTEVLEDQNGQWVDTGAQEAASGPNQELATVGAIHRAEDGRGKGQSEPQQVQGRHKALAA